VKCDEVRPCSRCLRNGHAELCLSRSNQDAKPREASPQLMINPLMPETSQSIPSSMHETMSSSNPYSQAQPSVLRSNLDQMGHSHQTSPISISPSVSTAQVFQQTANLNPDTYLSQQNFQQQIQLQLQIQQQLRELQQKQLQLDMLQQRNLIAAPKQESPGVEPMLLVKQLQAVISNNCMNEANYNSQQVQSNPPGLFLQHQHQIAMQDEKSNADDAIASLVALRNPQEQFVAEQERGSGEETRKRHRITTKRACDACRRSKVKCEDVRPCTRCVRNGHGDLCTGSTADAEASTEREDSATLEAKRNSVSSNDSFLPVDGYDSQLPEAKLKRCRVAKKMACDTCRRSKVRCDTERPCSRCVGLAQESTCMSSLGELQDKKMSPTNVGASISDEPKVPTFSAVLNADVHKATSWQRNLTQSHHNSDEMRGSMTEDTSSHVSSTASSPPDSLSQPLGVSSMLPLLQPGSSKSLDLSALLALNAQNPMLLNSLAAPLSLGLLMNNNSLLSGLRPSVQLQARDFSAEPSWDFSTSRIGAMQPLMQGVVLGR